MNEVTRRILNTNYGARTLLRHMLTNNRELVPEYDSKVGFRYPDGERYFGGSTQETQHVLRKLYEGGILLKKYRDKAVACPSCLSPVISVRYLCPSCSSSNVQKQNAVEHLIDELAILSSLPTVHRRRMDSTESKTREAQGSPSVVPIFLCRRCGRSFDKPTQMHHCGKCKFDFTIGEASFIDVYSYVLSEEIREEFESGGLSIMPIKSAFEKYKFDTLTPGYLIGGSGNAFSFDLLGRRKVSGKDKCIVLDLVCFADPLDPSPVSSLMGKLIDTNADVGILVAIGGLGSTGRNLAELYSIRVVEAEESVEAARKIEELLTSVG